jgi:hypothetical protein
VSKHRRTAFVLPKGVAARPGLVQLVTVAVACLLGLGGLTIAISSVTGDAHPQLERTGHSDSGQGGIDGTATAPSVRPASPSPTASTRATDDGGTSTDGTPDATEPAPTEAPPTATTTEPRTKPTHKPGAPPTTPPGKDK